VRKGTVLLDTGPLVAFLNVADPHHTWAKTHFGTSSPPLLTCESVVSEACFLLARAKRGSRSVMDLLERGVIAVGIRLEAEFPAIARLMERFESVPMSLADACLVRLSEIVGECTVMTLDSHFRIYRRFGRQVVPILTPGE